jgi:diadenosine tetraphosphate (Ap4A) HIT family hydrolase
VEGCLACDLADGRLDLPGGRILEVDGWIVEHCVGALGVGTLIVKPRRHVLHISELEAGEASALGPLLARVAAVVERLTSAEQVYVTLWSHHGGVPGHIHFVVQPVTREVLEAYPGLYGPALQTAMFERGNPLPTDAVTAFADAARSALLD